MADPILPADPDEQLPDKYAHLYPPRYSREELCRMLDELAAAGYQWLVEQHFEAWHAYTVQRKGGVR